MAEELQIWGGVEKHHGWVSDRESEMGTLPRRQARTQNSPLAPVWDEVNFFLDPRQDEPN